MRKNEMLHVSHYVAEALKEVFKKEEDEDQEKIEQRTDEEIRT